MNKLPSNYCSCPMGSVFQKAEPEWIAQNIMKILKRTGNTWRELSEEEYTLERIKDIDTDKGGGYSIEEIHWFRQVISYCKSSDTADLFCKGWFTETKN